MLEKSLLKCSREFLKKNSGPHKSSPIRKPRRRDKAATGLVPLAQEYAHCQLGLGGGGGVVVVVYG